MTETNENRELKTQLQHIADGGYHCPRCGSEELDGAWGAKSIDNYEYRDFECLDCEYRYAEEYILNGYWPKGDDDESRGPTLVEHLRQQLRWARKTIAKLREDKERQTFDLMQVLRERKDLRDMMLLSREPNVRCRSGMLPVGSTPLLKVRHKKGAIATDFGGYSTIQHDQILDPLWNALEEKAASKDEEGGVSYKATTSNDEQGDEE